MAGEQTGSFVTDVAGVAATTGGGILAIPNPEGVPLIIRRAILHKTTQSTGAATGDLGVAANGTTTSDTLIDGVSLQGTGVVDNLNDAGTNGKSRQTWGATEYVTLTGSATSVGLVGRLYIDYIRQKP